MHTEMWEHPATRDNVRTLRARGVHVVEPASGRLTGADTGPGRLPEPEDIYAVCRGLLSGAGPTLAAPTLAGRRVVVSAGGTREPLDPVRYLGNRSSGKQGYALAAVAAARGADVTLVAANTSLPAPAGVDVVPVGTVLELQAAVTAAAKGADVVVMAAAPADFRPARYSEAKIKKTFTGPDPDGDTSAPTIELVRNPDVLAGLVAARGSGTSPVIVGFAAETGDAAHTVLDHARAKLKRKGCDLIVANEVGVDKTFGQDTTTVHILRRGSDAVTDAGPASKEAVAATVWDVIEDVLPPR
jgi:phosphopantothenoylcysteine decarboxylase/phosphopantothenate--cysteine ligase